MPKQERLKAQLSNHLMRTSLSKMWDKVRDIIAPGISPISSYYYHSLCNEVTKASSFKAWQKAKFWRACDCIQHQQIIKLKSLKDRIEMTPLIRYQYLHIYTILREILQQKQGMRQLSEFEIVVSMGHIPKGFMAYCYRLLNTSSEANLFKQKWQRELNCEMQQASWQFWYNFGIKLSCNSNIRENTFKLYSRWYLTPVRISEMYGGNGRCWCCQEVKAGHRRIWWDCSRIKKNWKTVASNIFTITKKWIRFLPQIFLPNMIMDACTGMFQVEHLGQLRRPSWWSH